MQICAYIQIYTHKNMYTQTYTYIYIEHIECTYTYATKNWALKRERERERERENNIYSKKYANLNAMWNDISNDDYI